MDKLIILYYYLRTGFVNRFWLRSRNSIERMHRRRIRRFLARILPRSPYYQERFRGHDPDAWETLPATEKADMMTHFDRLNTVGATAEKAFEVACRAERERHFRPMLPGQVTVGLSSGTSGGRGLFLVGRLERLKWAGAVLAKVLPRSIFGTHRIAFFLRADSNLYETVNGGRIRFEFFDLLLPLEKHLERLNLLRPTLLVAPPSMLRILAERRSELRFPMERVVSVAEVLEVVDRSVIEEAFGPCVHQVYQAAEGFLGATCSRGTLHLNEDLLAVQKEYIDRDGGRFIPVITDFNRTSQPVIRYRLNDILTERKTPCPCGSPLLALERIEGRCDDIFLLPGEGGKIVPVFPDFISRAMITAVPELHGYQAIQTASLEIRIHVSPMDPAIRNRVAASLNEMLTRCGCARLPEFTFGVPEPRVSGKKFKRIERRWNPDEP